MASTQTETIKVKQLSKFGFQLESGEYVNVSKTLKDSEKGKIIPGGQYDVEMYRSDAGKGYINKLLSSALVAPAGVAPVFNKTPVAKPVETKPLAAKPNVSEVMSKAEWNAKDRSMMLGGLAHDAAVLAAASVTANVPIEAVLTSFEFAFGVLIKLREEVK